MLRFDSKDVILTLQQIDYTSISQQKDQSIYYDKYIKSIYCTTNVSNQHTPKNKLHQYNCREISLWGCSWQE